MCFSPMLLGFLNLQGPLLGQKWAAQSEKRRAETGFGLGRTVAPAGSLAPSCFLLLVVKPGAPSSVLAPSSDRSDARSP